jgi:CRP-like cAMP-binding protein
MRKVLFILGQLTDQDVEWIAGTGSRIDIAGGATLIEQGKAVGDLYIVLDGSLSVAVSGVGEITRIGSGEIVGEMSFVDQRPPSASVTALGPCRLLRLPRATLDSKIAGDPPFAARFYKALATFLSDRLRGTVSRLGFGKTGELDDEEMEGELDLEVLDKVHLAGARFDRMLKRLNGIEA